MIMKTVHKS